MYPVIDLHEDIPAYFILHGGGEPLGDFSEDIPGRAADIPKYLRGNVKLVFSAIFPGIETFKPEESRELERVYGRWLPGIGFRVPQALTIEHFAVIHRLVEEYRQLRLVESVADIDEVLGSKDLVGLIIHLEGADSLDNPYDLALLKRLGLRSVGITWNYNNKYGSGCSSRKDFGLTPEGEELVKVANKHGIIVDLAHAGKRTALEAIEVSKKPVIISHTNVRKFVDTPRNVDEEILEALHRNGGVVGLSCIGPLIVSEGEVTLSDLLKHFKYVYESFGAEILAIGTDFLGLLGLPAPKGFESIDKVQALLNGLLDMGFSEVDVEGVAYRNALRVIKENLAC